MELPVSFHGALLCLRLVPNQIGELGLLQAQPLAFFSQARTETHLF